MLFSIKLKKTHAELKKNIVVKIDDQTLDMVNKYKYLDMIVDEKLTTSHIKMIRQIITSRLFILKKVRWALVRKKPHYYLRVAYYAISIKIICSITLHQ